MELTPENAVAGDRAYLNLLLWQAVGSSPTGSLWSSIVGVTVQGVLLGAVGTRVWPVISDKLRLSKYELGGVGVALAVALAIFGVSLHQTHRLMTDGSDYLNILRADQTETLAVIGLVEALGIGSMGYGAWRVWKLTEKKVLIPLLLLVPLITLGVVFPIITHGLTVPIPTVSKFSVFDSWIERQALLLRVWMGSILLGSVVTWPALVYYTTQRKFEDTRRSERMICEAFCPSTVMSLITLIYLCATPGSLDNASRPLVQSLPSLFLLTILHPIITESCGNIHLPMYSYTSPPAQNQSHYSRASSSLAFGFTSTYEPRAKSQKSSVRTGGGSAKGTVHSHVSDALSHVPSLSPPPSAYGHGRAPPSAWAFGQSGSHYPPHSHSRSGSHAGSSSRRRYTPSQASSLIPTPSFQPDFPDVPLSIIAPFTDWLEYDPFYASGDRDSESVKTNAAPSFKSAVPSGKTLYRSKSERTRKGVSVVGSSPGTGGNRGIVLDRTGWNDIPPPPPAPAHPLLLIDRDAQQVEVAVPDQAPGPVLITHPPDGEGDEGVQGSEAAGTGSHDSAEMKTKAQDPESELGPDKEKAKNRRQSKAKSKSSSGSKSTVI